MESKVRRLRRQRTDRLQGGVRRGRLPNKFQRINNVAVEGLTDDLRTMGAIRESQNDS